MFAIFLQVGEDLLHIFPYLSRIFHLFCHLNLEILSVSGHGHYSHPSAGIRWVWCSATIHHDTVWHVVNLLLGRSNKKYDKMVSAIEKARKALRYRKIQILDAEHTEFLPMSRSACSGAMWIRRHIYLILSATLCRYAMYFLHENTSFRYSVVFNEVSSPWRLHERLQKVGIDAKLTDAHPGWAFVDLCCHMDKTMRHYDITIFMHDIHW